VSVGLYLDVHVPASITRGLVLRGVEVLTAQIDGTTEWKDPDLLDRATELGRVLFSQDEDLLAEPVNARARFGLIQNIPGTSSGKAPTNTTSSTGQPRSG
jgi:predicted nuclease of predicted toxin-antitoxin system